MPSPPLDPLSRLNGKIPERKTQTGKYGSKKKTVWRAYPPFECHNLVHLTAHLWMITWTLSCDLRPMGMTSTAQQKWHQKKHKIHVLFSITDHNARYCIWSLADSCNIKLQTRYHPSVLKCIAQACIAWRDCLLTRQGKFKLNSWWRMWCQKVQTSSVTQEASVRGRKINSKVFWSWTKAMKNANKKKTTNVQWTVMICLPLCLRSHKNYFSTKWDSVVLSVARET